MVILWVIGASVAVSLISLVGIFTLLFNQNLLKRILILPISFSAGALIGVAFLHLLPEAQEKAPGSIIYVYLLSSYVLFFVLEKYLAWRHCHEDYCPIHPFTYLNLIGDGIHNFFDGVVIGTSFVVGIKFGIVTTIVIILHEIPQEIGDFAVLIYGGFSKYKALVYNFLSAAMAIFGSIAGYYFSDNFQNFSKVILPFAAGGFIYIASCDLIPEIHKETNLTRSSLSIIFFILGVAFTSLVKFLH